MIKKQKQDLVNTLKPMFDGTHLYVVDSQGLTANQLYTLRHALHQENVRCRQVPNSLLRIIFSNTVYTALTDTLQQSSLLLFIKENPKKAAQVIQTFRKKQKTDKPTLKGAWAFQDIFLGEKSLEQLAQLKSKEELIADVIALLQSQGQQLINTLQHGQNSLCSLLKTIEEEK